MKPQAQDTAGAGRPSTNEDEATGLPWPHTWRGVYLLVVGSFVLWVGLLVALTVVFS
jgi:hypothetical protein